MGTKHYNYNCEITLLPSLDIMNHKTWSIYKAGSIVRSDPSSNDIIEIVLAHLLLNTKQEIIICKIIYYTMCNQVTLRPDYLDQLLLVIRDKSSIDKSQVIKIIRQTYNIIGKNDSIFIIAPIKIRADNISECTLHTALGIDTRKIKEIVKGL